jgi:hypothetical protein
MLNVNQQQYLREIRENKMAKVEITGLATRKTAKDYGKVTPLHKPAASSGPAKAYAMPPTVAQDKKYNEVQM